MYFFFHYADFFALSLVFFGLAFFLLRSFFFWYLRLPELVSMGKETQCTLVQLSKQILDLSNQVRTLTDDQEQLEQNQNNRLKTLAEDTLAPTKPDDSDFRPVLLEIKQAVEKRRAQRACLYCGIPASKGSLFCCADHQTVYQQGGVIEPINLRPATQQPEQNR